LGDNIIKNIEVVDPITGALVTQNSKPTTNFTLYPAKHFIADPTKNKDVFKEIRKDLLDRIKYFKSKGKDLEAERIKQKVTYDLETIEAAGYVKGIENYSRYFDGRAPGDPPYTLLDYFKEATSKQGHSWLTFIDESHITFPQIRGMFAGDLSRKKTLIDYGFRLPSAYDNRPLTFDEFMRKIPGFIATSATPSDWEISMAKGGVVEQLLRPTGILDPEVDIRPVKGQVKDVIGEIKKRAKKKQRTLVTTLTKKTAEDLAQYVKEQGIKVHYLHSDIATLERTDILDDLRKGRFDCLIGVNLLREGLDLPEVSLVAILDADKEGFLRSEVSLIQTMGRASRHVDGEVLLYADNITGSIKRALKEVERRRIYQKEINKKLGIKPKSIIKPIRRKLIEKKEDSRLEKLLSYKDSKYSQLPEIDVDSLTPMDKRKLIVKLRREMSLAAHDLNFEFAAEIRDKISELKA